MSNQDSTTFVDSVASQAPAPPVRRKSRRRKNKPRNGLSHSTAPNQPAIEIIDDAHSYFKDGITATAIWLLIRHWLRTAMAAGYGISLLIHAVALLIMSFVVLSQIDFEESIISSISSDDETSLFDEIVDVRMDMPEGDISLEKDLDSATNMDMADWADNPITTGVEDSIESLFEKDGAKGLGGGGFMAPPNSRIFKKGSFSAWTIPDDPEPGQDYVIVIVVKLPKRVKRYRASDLVGLVVGTDGYRQAVPGPQYSRGTVYLPMKDHMAKLVVKVPGGASRVRDVINIRSKTLKEKQKIELEF